MEYYLYMTNNCNLMCTYCSANFDCKKNNIPFKPTYEKEELLAFIKKTQAAQPDKDVTIFFFGGEPTLEYAKISEAIPYFKKELSEYDLSFVIHTNGLLLDKIPLDVLSSLRLITLSVNYEKIPRFNLKGTYFETLMNGISYIKKNSNVPLAGRLTISQHTSLYQVMRLFGPFFNNVYWQIDNCSAFTEGDKYVQTVMYETELLFNDWLEQLKKGTLVEWVPFVSVLKFMFYPDRSDEHFCCGYDGHQVYIQTEGTCFACCDNVPKGAHTIGDIHNGIEFTSKKVTDYPACKGCSYRRLCMGRCGRMHVDFTAEHIAEYCKINQFMFDLFIKNKPLLEESLKKIPNIEQKLSSWFFDITEYIP